MTSPEPANAANPQRFDPYKSYRFQVVWDGRVVAGVSHVSPLVRRTEVVQWREGSGSAVVRSSPGRTTYDAVTLERGITLDPAFEQWAQLAYAFGAGIGSEVALASFRKDITIRLQNEAGQVIAAWNVYRCWVSEYAALPDLDAGSGAVAVERIVLANEGWQRDVSVVPPVEPGGGS